MPAGLKRYSGHDYLHFLTCSCYHRQPWVASPPCRDLFLQILEEARQRYQFVVVGYVVMLALAVSFGSHFALAVPPACARLPRNFGSISMRSDWIWPR